MTIELLAERSILREKCEMYEKAIEDIKAEIKAQIINKDERSAEEILWNNALQKCCEIIDKYLGDNDENN